MLIIMADLLAVSVGNVFMAAIVPGLCLAALYLIYVGIYARVRPEVAPPLPPELLSVPRREYPGLIFKSFLPPVLLISMIKGSILLGVATPSEAGAVGAFGVMLLALFNRRLTVAMVQGVCHTSARTVAMIFFIIVSATCFAYVYRSLGGDDIVEHLILNAGLDSWGLLILIMAITFCLGFFLDWIEITLIVLPVFAPLVAGMDFGDHIATNNIIFWFIILMAINLPLSLMSAVYQ
jgi:TRAP-type mannitol/chloroaromatic compound transport system permease large subunit